MLPELKKLGNTRLVWWIIPVQNWNIRTKPNNIRSKNRTIYVQKTEQNTFKTEQSMIEHIFTVWIPNQQTIWILFAYKTFWTVLGISLNQVSLTPPSKNSILHINFFLWAKCANKYYPFLLLFRNVFLVFNWASSFLMCTVLGVLGI